MLLLSSSTTLRYATETKCVNPPNTVSSLWGQAFLINVDAGMYDPESNTPAKARTSNLNQDLGQVRTGTGMGVGIAIGHD